jgi:glycine/D-amino acid oxidase-like deaminating enzyme
MTAQRPGNRISQTVWSGTYSLIHEKGYGYMSYRPPGSKFAGDIAIGGGLTKALHGVLYEFGTTDDTTVDPVIIGFLQNCTVDYFGSNWGSYDDEGRLRKAWTGIMGFSVDQLPFIGPLPEEEGSYIAASFQG